MKKETEESLLLSLKDNVNLPYYISKVNSIFLFF